MVVGAATEGTGAGGGSRPRPGARPTGTVTRGTTHRNRLRRMDRWIVAEHGAALRRSPRPPLAVDLGYGAAPWTAVELAGRLRVVRPDVRLLGLEIDPARVAAATPFAGEGLSFGRGGFEVPLGGFGAPGGRPLLIRAANVLRQYPEEEVPTAWRLMCGRLAPDGLLVEGTCDEIGRRHAWVALGPEGPRTLTLAARLADLDTPGDLAERLPKALIHRNVPGEPVHAWLRDLDRAWAAAAPFGALGARQRWLRTVRSVAADWPVRGGHARHRQGEVTVDWSAVAPR
ncbi:class I SAM-dependent methyltransferase [Streptomyces alkaliphilus]|uniref:Class I SAM-dependent methyltransferase n=1 Tax=Streptomyces alkaliphilus TaxID=1472722 RepID=A0A7W3Y2W8_9ACTN|nr:class I SAM-dependent methyltransferase [Streptomyces alkaliphilus]MBB0245846.1 class I SAM-dependent methyltransferase [Streptomyces alkaliphilus]